MERQHEAFKRKGVNVAALSFDSPTILRHFAERREITFTLLSDPEAEVIRAFGILNPTIPVTHERYGIPNPGEYLIGPDGVVKAKYFAERPTERVTAANVLIRELDGEPSGAQSESETAHLTLRSWVSDQSVKGKHRFAVGVDVTLKPRMHVYAPGVEGGYIPVEFRVETIQGVEVFGARYPESELIELPVIDETVPVYQESFRVLADVKVGYLRELGSSVSADGELKLRGVFRYQACDDKRCYLPVNLPLEWKVNVEDYDLTRVPEHLRRNASRP